MSDIRQDSIVFQSALKIMVQIELYRAAKEDRDINVKKMIEDSKFLALVARNPDLDKFYQEHKSGNK